MYIIKNALRCISRSLARNILICLIVLVIAVSACIGLSIGQATENAKKEAMISMSVTANISFDRTALMENMRQDMEPPAQGEQPENFDRSQFKEMMGNASSLSLEEYEKYAKADSVKDFYYTMSVALNGSDDFEPVSNKTTTSDNSTTENTQDNTNNPFGGISNPMEPGNRGGREHMMGAQSDFSVEGVSSEDAMTSFINGTSTITDGAIFAEGTENYECIISQELATYNNISVNDKIVLTNPNNEDESYIFTVTGIYSDSSANEESFSMMGATSTDPANKIYVSYNALQKIIDTSANSATTQTDENTGMKFSTAVTGNLTATYTFANTEDYYKFEEQVREMGLEDTYTVSSQDITAFENSLIPLNTLSTTAGYFLIVILIIGAIILIVLNIFNVRERKYEIGVLTAMGMKKIKVAMQFLTESFIVTLIAVILGLGIGAVSSVPVANALLDNQVASQTASTNQIEQNFGREGFGDMRAPEGNTPNDIKNGMSKGDIGNPFEGMFNDASNYITEINSAMNFTVVLQMLCIAVLLTIASGMVSILFVMRYDPLKILANRD